MRLEPDDNADTFLHRFTRAYRKANPDSRFNIDAVNSTWVDDFVLTTRRHRVISHLSYFTPSTVRDAARALEGYITAQRRKLDTLTVAREAAQCSDMLDLDPMYQTLVPRQAATAAAQVTKPAQKQPQKQKSKPGPSSGPPPNNGPPTNSEPPTASGPPLNSGSAPAKRELTDE